MTRTNPKPATCSRCDSTDVAWAKSKKTDKFYLTEVFTDADGDRVTDHRDFHSKYCGKPGAHALVQNSMNKQVPTDPAPDADAEALRIASLLQPQHYVIEICKLAKGNRPLAVSVLAVWQRQGENRYAEILEGVLNA